jgi:hypothetical protein
VLVNELRRAGDCKEAQSFAEPLVPVAVAIQRLQGMFRDVPGTRLSVADAACLSGCNRSTCRYVLETLADSMFLKRGRNGAFTYRQADTVER